MEDQIHVSLTPEKVKIFGIELLNSQLTTIVVMVLLAILILSALARPKLVPGRWQAFWEYIVESMLNLVENSLGRNKTARILFPLVATLFIFILFANWFSLLPGVGTIGHPEAEVVPNSSATGVSANSYALTSGETEVYSQPGNTAKSEKKLKADSAVRVLGVQGEYAEVQAVPHKVYQADPKEYKNGQIVPFEEGSASAVRGFVPTSSLTPGKLGQLLVPLVRPPNADLNMTLAMALIAVIMANVVAIVSHGFLGWLKEFFPKPYVMDILLTPIEIIGQVARVLSLTFRLFGNIFAGEALLAVILNIAAPALVIFLALELFFGFIQALVFASLTTVYLTLAFVGLGEGDDHGHGEEEHEHSEGDRRGIYPSEAAPKEREAVGSL